MIADGLVEKGREVKGLFVLYRIEVEIMRSFLLYTEKVRLTSVFFSRHSLVHPLL